MDFEEKEFILGVKGEKKKRKTVAPKFLMLSTSIIKNTSEELATASLIFWELLQTQTDCSL